jgi:hypothetical protein
MIRLRKPFRLVSIVRGCQVYFIFRIVNTVNFSDEVENNAYN